MKAALLLLAAAAVGAAGCTNNDLSLSIQQMQAVTRANQCVAMATATAGSLSRDRGLLDVSLMTTAGYIAVPVVRNNLMPLQNNIEYNSIQLLGVNIKLSDAATGTQLVAPYFYAAAGGRLDPGGFAPMFVEVMPPAEANLLAKMIGASGVYSIIAEIRPVGMRSNDQVVGGPISFPIDICNGCLTPPPMTCPFAKGTTLTDPCFPQQDEPSRCCTDTTGRTLCGSAAPVSTM